MSRKSLDMICGDGKILKRRVGTEDLMKMLIEKLEVEKMVCIVPLSHKFTRVYANSERKILKEEETGTWVGDK